MPVQQDFVLGPFEDGTLFVSMVPPLNITGLAFQFQMTRRLGGTPIVTKSMASGYYGTSGMNTVNAGAGVFSVALTAAEVSGYDPGNYSYTIQTIVSGQNVVASEGYKIAIP